MIITTESFDQVRDFILSFDEDIDTVSCLVSSKKNGNYNMYVRDIMDWIHKNCEGDVYFLINNLFLNVLGFTPMDVIMIFENSDDKFITRMSMDFDVVEIKTIDLLESMESAEIMSRAMEKVSTI